MLFKRLGATLRNAQAGGQGHETYNAGIPRFELSTLNLKLLL
jgi:hypothetical protein